MGGVTATVVARALAPQGDKYVQVGQTFTEIVNKSSTIGGLEGRLFAKLRVVKDSTDGVYCAGINGLTFDDKKKLFSMHSQENNADFDDDGEYDAVTDDEAAQASDDGDGNNGMPTVPLETAWAAAHDWESTKVCLGSFVSVVVVDCVRPGAGTLLAPRCNFARAAQSCRCAEAARR